MNPQLLQQALAQHRAGRLREAEALYRQILATDPDHPEAIQYLGVMASQTARHDEAIALLRRAAALRPQSAEIHANLGAALQQSGRVADAIAAYRAAAALNPRWPDVYNMLGGALFMERRLDEAAAAFRQALELRPDFVQAWSNLGAAYNEMGHVDSAIDCCRKIIALVPDWPDVHVNLGIALAETGRVDEAMGSLHRALELQPQHLGAHNTLGLILQREGRSDEAEQHYLQALSAAPDAAAVHANLASALLEQGRVEEGFARIERAVALEPSNPLQLSNLLLALNYLPRMTPDQSLARHREWSKRFEQPLKPTIQPHANDRSTDRRLRIGYITQFFAGNPLTYFMERILANHDRSRFEIYFYSIVRQPDEQTYRFDGFADVSRSIAAVSDERAAQQIREDRIDILVDLVGHVGANRLTLMARKPAPVQASYIGHCNTTGLDAIDYRISDAIADPAGEQPARYSEQLVRLRPGFCCYAPPVDAPQVNAPPAESSNRITFASLHKLEKLNDDVLDLWCRLIKETPRARLLIVRNTLRGETARRLRARLIDRGLSGQQFELRCDLPAAGHLALYHDIDISLDAFPWSGHTTACESLWMGVPMVTLAGGTFASRMVASVLTQLELTDWIAQSPNDFVRIAQRAAADIGHLKTLRSSLREKMRTSEFCSGAALTRDMEEAYRTMWQTWCGQARGRGD